MYHEEQKNGDFKSARWIRAFFMYWFCSYKSIKWLDSLEGFILTVWMYKVHTNKPKLSECRTNGYKMAMREESYSNNQYNKFNVPQLQSFTSKWSSMFLNLRDRKHVACTLYPWTQRPPNGLWGHLLLDSHQHIHISTFPFFRWKQNKEKILNVMMLKLCIWYFINSSTNQIRKSITD